MTRLSSPKRGAVALNSSVEKRLFNYAAVASAAGVAVLALANSSEAKVVYTPTHQKISPNTTLSLDLNGDGVNDFVFSNRFNGPRGLAAPTSGSRTSAALSINPAAKTNAVWGYSGFVSALPSKIKLGPAGKFLHSRYFMGGVSAIEANHPTYNGPWAPADGDEINRYVGMKFVIDGQVHFGWARLNVKIRQTKNGGAVAELTGYAYETVANKPILTGQMSGTDDSSTEPISLGHLALGSATLEARQEKSPVH